jgi:hypothetical protein
VSRCCDEPDCRRKIPIGIYLADFSERVFAATSSRERSPGHYAAKTRHDITPQMRRFIKANPAWVRKVLREARP